MKAKVRRRKTLPRLVERTSAEVQVEVAIYGRQLSAAERAVSGYQYLFRRWKKGFPTPESSAALAESSASRLCEQMLAAVEAGDDEWFATAAKWLRSKPNMKEVGDTLRASIATLRDIYKSKGKTGTKNGLARFVKSCGLRIDDSQLYKTAKRLGFPFGKRGRPRK